MEDKMADRHPEMQSLSSPHPEAREEDIKAIREALELGKDYATQVLQGHDMMYKRHSATEGERKEIVDDIKKEEPEKVEGPKA